MNYRHGFHAGNFADVFKHAMLARILVYLTRKDAPLRYIDTHAGAGRYDLAAKRRGVRRNGATASRGSSRRARRPRSRRCFAPISTRSAPATTTGGRPPIPARRRWRKACCRPQDRLALCEAHPEEREALVAALGRDRRLSIVATDGYVALNAYVPPKERRGLVLIDPPYEAPDESARVESGARPRARRNGRAESTRCGGRSRTTLEDARFLNAIAALGAPNMLRLEIDVGAVAPGAHSPTPLRRTGLIIVNPPFDLIEEARVLMPWLAQALKRAGGRRIRLQWLTPPA